MRLSITTVGLLYSLYSVVLLQRKLDNLGSAVHVFLKLKMAEIEARLVGLVGVS